VACLGLTAVRFTSAGRGCETLLSGGRRLTIKRTCCQMPRKSQFLPPFAMQGRYSYGTGGVVRVVVCMGRSEPNVEGDVLGKKCLMEPIGTGSRYY
jgi:hypothetical protein